MAVERDPAELCCGGVLIAVWSALRGRPVLRTVRPIQVLGFLDVALAVAIVTTTLGG